MSCGTLGGLLTQTGVPNPVVELIVGQGTTTDGVFQLLGACAS